MLSFLSKFWNKLGASCVDFLAAIINLLPDSPFLILDNLPIAKYLPTLNYFIPIQEIIVIFESWLVAIGTYYLFAIALRWIKAIED